MATRTVTRFMAFFDDSGNLISFGAAGRIDGTDSYTNASGQSVQIRREEWYEVAAADLPAQFISDMEAVHVKIVSKLDNKYPVV